MLLCAVALVGACAGDGDTQSSTITVFAASSLTDVLGGDAQYVASGTTLDVKFNFAGSSTLREQILDGADADVFISANEAVMSDIIDAGLTDFPAAQIASNTLTIAVPKGNPGRVDGLSDLGEPSLTVGLCALQVPCGVLATEILLAQHVDASIDTFELNARSLLAKVELGELDAALVYRTDVLASPEVDEVELAPGTGGTTTYFAVQLSDHPAGQRFLEALLAGSFQERLADAGFEAL